uniref:Uncharacterized protein n=1 Tax=Setaria viridis TaxID=4556 RepID=A0A4U6VSE0_SETVI|nr:hypothetical protein SEVIR_2G188450v2 [Setaria viridis]
MGKEESQAKGPNQWAVAVLIAFLCLQDARCSSLETGGAARC